MEKFSRYIPNLKPRPVFLPNLPTEASAQAGPRQLQFLLFVHPQMDHHRGLFKQHCLYLRPLPHGQGSLRPILADTADRGLVGWDCKDCKRDLDRAR